MKSGRSGILSERDYKALQEMKDIINQSKPVHQVKYINVKR